MITSSDVFQRRLTFTLAVVFAMAMVTVVCGQPFENPYDNPFDTPPPKSAAPPSGTLDTGPAQPDQLPPELRGPRTPGRTTPRRTLPDTTQPGRGTAEAPGAPAPAQQTPPDADAMDDNPFLDDLVQPDDAEPMPSPSERTPRESTQPTEPDDSTYVPDTLDKALIDKINDLIVAEKFSEAIPLLENVAKQVPDVYDVWNELGKAYRMTGRLDEAIEAFGEAARFALEPKQEAEAHLRRGIAWFYKGEPRIAAKQFDRASSAWIEDPRPEFWKGLVLAHQGRYRDAISSYSAALRLYNGYTIARNNRGLAYLAIGELDFAIADFDEVILETPNDAAAYYKRAIALGRRGDLREAVASYNEAIRLESDFAPSYYNRGLLHRQLGNTQQANADLARARQLNPQIESLARPPRLARR